MNEQGWGFPDGSRKCHWFVDTMSLCHKWGFYRGPLSQDTGPSPDDCVACRKALDKGTIAAMMRAAEAETGEAS